MGRGLEMQEADIPQISPQEVLIKIKATSICGTDVHIYNWNPWAQGRIKRPLRHRPRVLRPRGCRWQPDPQLQRG